MTYAIRVPLSNADAMIENAVGGSLRVAVGASSETGNFNSVLTLREDGSWDVEAGTIYVWYDALINYATAVGYGQRVESAQEGRAEPVAAFAPDGRLVAMLDESGHKAKAHVVFAPAGS